MVLPTVGQALIHQSIFKTVFHRDGHWANASVEPPFSGNSGLCQVDKAKTQSQKTNMASKLYQSRTHPATDKTRGEVIKLLECRVYGNIFLLPL